MSEVWTYRLQDLLLFSPRVYWRTFELQNEAVWPAQLVTVVAGLALIALVRGRLRAVGIAIALALAGLWTFVGWSFLWNRYSSINWAIAYVAPMFILQAVLLVAAAAWREGLVPDRAGPRRRGGLLLAGAAIVAYPLAPPFFARPLAGAEVFGVAPDPTAVATLGFVLVSRGKLAPLLLPIPLAWLLLSGLTLHTMQDAQAWLPFAAIAITPVVLLLRSE